MKSIVKKILDTVRLYNGAIIHAIKNDYNSRYIKAVICTDGTPNNIENGSAITVSFKREETGEEKTFNGELNADGTVMVPITQWALGEIGVVSCWISVSQKDGNLTTLPILIEVHESGNDNGQITEDDPEYNDILSILARLSDHDGKIEQNLQDIEQNAKLVTSALEYTSRNSKRISNLEQRLDSSLFVTDDSVAYAKTVPEGALPYAEVAKIGGMSYRDETAGVLKNAVVTSIKSTGKNLLKFSKAEAVTRNGITFTKNDDGSVSVTGTATNTANFAVTKIKTLVFPTGEYYASIGRSTTRVYVDAYLGGAWKKTLRWNNGVLSIDSTDYDEIEVCLSVDKDTEVNESVFPMINFGSVAQPSEPYREYTFPIPAEVQALDGYGLGVNSAYYNYIDWQNKTYNKWIIKRVFSGETPVSIYTGKNGEKYFALTHIDATTMLPSSLHYPSLCNRYQIVSADGVYGGTETGVALNVYGAITFFDKDIQTVEALQAQLKEWNDEGNPLEFIYAIKTPIVTDISDLLPDDNFIEVSEGGLVIAENENGLDVPTTIAYQIKEVTA